MIKCDDPDTNLYQKHILAYLALENSLLRSGFVHITGNASKKLLHRL